MSVTSLVCEGEVTETGNVALLPGHMVAAVYTPTTMPTGETDGRILLFDFAKNSV